MSSNGSSSGALAGERRYAWYRELSGYHWFVLSVASMGWMFDTMAQQLFNLARKPAIKELLGAGASNATIDQQAAWATSIFMIGWAIGVVFFGILGDRIGRVKTMTITILSYTVFTGLSVLSTSVWNFNVFRFLCGLGVGGQFAVGVALVAEVVPSRAPAPAPASSLRPTMIPVLAASMLPMADDACTNPSAYGRARDGTTSAT